MITYPVSVGRLIRTRSVKQWSQEERETAHNLESRMLFCDFSFEDEGRSRRLIATCSSPEEATMLAAALNAGLVALDKLEKIKGLKGPSINISDMTRILGTHILG